MLKENYDMVAEKVRGACERSGRNPEEVTIIAVSKTKPLKDVVELSRHGVIDFGVTIITLHAFVFGQSLKKLFYELLRSNLDGRHLQAYRVYYI